MSALVTGWMPADTPPVRVGVYEVSDHDDDRMPCQWFAYWDGKKFCYRYCSEPQSAFDCRDIKTCLPPLVKWRGIRRWVLAMTSSRGTGYLIYATSCGVGHLSQDLLQAIGFDSEAEANAYRLKLRDPSGIVAVLP